MNACLSSCGATPALGVLSSQRGVGADAEYFQNGSRATAVAYTKALAEYRANPYQETYNQAQAAFQVDHAVWLTEQHKRERTVTEQKRSYESALARHEKDMKVYISARFQWNMARQESIDIQRLHDSYPARVGKWQASLEQAKSINARRANEYSGAQASYDRYYADWQRDYAAWQDATRAYQLAVRQRNTLLGRLNAPVFAKWGGDMPTGYPGCLADTVRDEYQRRCDARFIEGLGAFPPTAITETSGPWAGIPICMLAELPKCSQIGGLPSPPPSVPPQQPTPPVRKPDVPLPTRPSEPPIVPKLAPEPMPPPKPPAPDRVLPLRPEPKPPSTGLMQAAGGLRVSGLLLVALLAGGGLVAWKLKGKRKKKTGA